MMGYKERVSFFRRIRLVVQMGEAGILYRSQVQGKQIIFTTLALPFLLLFVPFIHPPPSKNQRRKPCLSPLVNSWNGLEAGMRYRRERKREGLATATTSRYHKMTKGIFAMFATKSFLRLFFLFPIKPVIISTIVNVKPTSFIQFFFSAEDSLSSITLVQ